MRAYTVTIRTTDNKQVTMAGIFAHNPDDAFQQGLFEMKLTTYQVRKAAIKCGRLTVVYIYGDCKLTQPSIKH